MVFSESVVEEAAVGWFRELGYQVVGGPDTLLGLGAVRNSYSDVVLLGMLRDSLTRLNPHLPTEALADALRRLTRHGGSTLRARNRAFHQMLVNGVSVEYQEGDGIRGAQVQVIDFDDASSNEWLVVNQFTVVEDKNMRRPDIVVFVNGLPLGVVELKNPADEEATVWEAWQQLQTYKAELPSLFSMNEILVVSDGIQTLAGTLTAGREWFKPWRTIEGEELAPATLPSLKVLIRGVFEKKRFLDLVRDFVVFEDDGGGGLVKKMAGYHQFHAVQAAVDQTLRAARLDGPSKEPWCRHSRSRSQTGWSTWGPADRRGLAHAGVGQELDHGLLCRGHHPPGGHGEPDHRGLDRP